jgi:DNA invertase Pin-like site-specific DNA recombinase
VPNVGYARVSTSEQDLALQKDALKKIGCERIFTDHASGAKTDRPGLNEALSYVRDGDVLVVWKFDRLGRSLPHLIETITDLNARRIGLHSLTENIDTTTPGGRLIFHVFGALAAFERDLVKERTKAALAAAKARGQTLGNPRLADACAAINASRVAGAEAHADIVLPAIREVQAAGAQSLREIATALNGRGIAAARGGKWESCDGGERSETGRRLAHRRVALHPLSRHPLRLGDLSGGHHGGQASRLLQPLSETPEMGRHALAGGATRPRLPLGTGLDGHDSTSGPYSSAKWSESRGPSLRCPKTRTSLAAPKPRLA